MRTCRARSARREGAQAPDANPVFKIYGENEEKIWFWFSRARCARREGAQAPDANSIFKIWGQQPLHQRCRIILLIRTCRARSA